MFALFLSAEATFKLKENKNKVLNCIPCSYFTLQVETLFSYFWKQFPHTLPYVLLPLAGKQFDLTYFQREKTNLYLYFPL